MRCIHCDKEYNFPEYLEKISEVNPEKENRLFYEGEVLIKHRFVPVCPYCHKSAN